MPYGVSQQGHVSHLATMYLHWCSVYIEGGPWDMCVILHARARGPLHVSQQCICTCAHLAGGHLTNIALWRDESSSRFSNPCCRATLNIARVPGRHIELAANCGHGARALAGGHQTNIALWRDESSSRFSNPCCSATLNIARVPGRHIELTANCGH